MSMMSADEGTSIASFTDKQDLSPAGLSEFEACYHSWPLKSSERSIHITER